MELERIPLRLQDVLQRVLVLLRTMADERLVDLTLELAPDAPDEVLGDPMRLSQVGTHTPQSLVYIDILHLYVLT
jgi:signal transduction histidine kinase